MSRSYKKTPGWCDRNPWMKNYANRRLRRLSRSRVVPNGGAYKKFTNPWNICDRKCLYFSDMEIAECYLDYSTPVYKYFMK